MHSSPTERPKMIESNLSNVIKFKIFNSLTNHHHEKIHSYLCFGVHIFCDEEKQECVCFIDDDLYESMTEKVFFY